MFTDDGGTQETLTSAPVGPVGPALPAISIEPQSRPAPGSRGTRSPQQSKSDPAVTEGEEVVFTLTRTGATTAALTISVSVSESGSMLDGTPPATVTFEAGRGPRR